MEYIMGKKLANISWDMNIIKTLCKINEYKGEQIIYKKQSKNMVSTTTEEAITKFVYDTHIDNFMGGEENLIKLINNEITPQSREEIAVVEFRDVIKTVNSAYEDIKINSQTILELHGYLHRYSLVRGGRYRNEDINFYNMERNNLVENIQTNSNLNMEECLEKEVEYICDTYYKLIEEDKIQELIIIAAFIRDFISIWPFKEDNIKMAKILTLLLLNKSGYEVGRFTSLGKLYDDSNQLLFRKLISTKDDFERESNDIKKWVEYFLSFVEKSYEDLSDEMNLAVNKKETKTRRIEKIINSTLGYFTKDDIRNQCPDIPEPTINRVFNNLRKSGKIEVVAKGRSAKWKKK
ncbi:Fic family protein [Terrisporobacter sp.]|uniref:Fic family protein n=1 Tax=Terrisporobacter sp. TaxID=1965305 RepID=UPI002A8227F8|nr:Fic family protein [Terrisporobacter sp.]MDY4136977.1 Fic family protein [Terrisporobacter sp.]